MAVTGQDLPMMLVVAAFALLFISWLLWIQLGSLGVPRRRVMPVLAELWVSFALIIALFSIASALIGPVVRQPHAEDEFRLWWTQVRALTIAKQALLLALLAAALGVLGLFTRALSTLRRQYEPIAPDTDETTEEHHEH